jgi:UDP-glucose 4-epimerase
MARTVLVTGGAGFIGSHTVDRLIEGGYRVVVLDDFSTGKRENLARWDGNPALAIVTADVARPIAEPLAPHGRIDHVIHLAAQVSVIASIADPVRDMQVNYGGTLHVLEYARAHGVRKVVLASSAAVYGDVDRFPVVEDSPTRPMSPYGIHKLASEHALDYYAAVHHVPVTSLRFFNVFGPRQDPSSPYSGVISIFADRARAGRELVVFGDGSQSRDFVFVGDVARAVVTAATEERGDRAVVNIGTGKETTIAALARAIVDRCGGRSAIRHAPARDGEIARSVAAVERARAVLGFAAEVGLDEGLARTVGSPP